MESGGVGERQHEADEGDFGRSLRILRHNLAIVARGRVGFARFAGEPS
jgi:hypothetical protein